MTPEDLIKQGQPKAALAELMGRVRDNPADPRLRIFLFQLMCVVGEYERAMKQLNVAAEMDPSALLMAQTYRMMLQCEPLRQEVFAGKRTPLVFGEPEPWISQMLQALKLQVEGELQAAHDMRSEALELAPACSGSLNGEAFDWISDADSRLGPILEVVANGKYYWVPMHRIHKIALEAPSDLRDMVWIPAQFTWATGGQMVGLIPTRYPGTESSEDEALLLSRKTDWAEPLPSLFVGTGQRMLMTDSNDYSLLEVRELVLDTSADASDQAS